MWLIVLSLMVLLVSGHFLRTLPNISDFLRPLESTILKEFIPAVTGRSVSHLRRMGLVFPSSLNGGCLVSCNPSATTNFEFNTADF